MDLIYQFLAQIKQNNNKNWFAENKDLYQKAKNQFENLVSQILNKLSEFEPLLTHLSPKDVIFRFHRDTRFSKDKRPYKEYFCAFFAPGGKKSQFAGYYLHIEPNNTFVGGGIYCPKSQILNAIRWYIYENPQQFIKIISSQEFKNTFGQIFGEKLKRPPRGFPKNFPYIELLKYKSYAIMTHLPDKPSVNQIISEFKKMKPFNDFINTAILKALE